MNLSSRESMESFLCFQDACDESRVSAFHAMQRMQVAILKARAALATPLWRQLRPNKVRPPLGPADLDTEMPPQPAPPTPGGADEPPYMQQLRD